MVLISNQQSEIRNVLHDGRDGDAHDCECGDQLASSTLLTTALAGLLRAHAAPGLAGGPGPVRKAPDAVATVRDLLVERLDDPPTLTEPARRGKCRPSRE